MDTLIEADTKLPEETTGPLFDQITRDLLAYAVYHFDTEEVLMRQHGYAAAQPEEAARHVAQHRGFSERVVALRADARQGRDASREALLAFLRDWLTNHILTSDKRLGRFVQATEEL